MPTLREGAVSVYVQMLQLALIRAGIDTGDKDGIFGQKTRRAVLEFQRREGLEVDGIVGMFTWAALEPYLTGYVSHTVARGETFWQLARRYRTSVSVIRAANPNVDPFNLRIGSKIVIPLAFDVVPTDIDYTYALVTYIIKGLVMRYPFLASSSVGESVLGRELYVLRFGRGRKEVFYNAAHHANEWITTPLLLKFAEDISSAYVSGERVQSYEIREIFANVSIYILPLVNPDGVDIVTGGISPGTLAYESAKEIAENYPSVRFPLGWKANIAGTDLNLNYPAGWETAKEIKYAQGIVSPAPRDFVGAEPLSARETRAVYEFTRAHDFALTVSYHTQGKEIYWRYLDIVPEGALEIGKEFEQVSGYRLKLTPPQSSYAGYKDWFILQYERPGYTVEAGRGQNPLSISDFDSIYRDNFGILLLGAVLA